MKQKHNFKYAKWLQENESSINAKRFNFFNSTINVKQAKKFITQPNIFRNFIPNKLTLLLCLPASALNRSQNRTYQSIHLHF